MNALSAQIRGFILPLGKLCKSFNKIKFPVLIFLEWRGKKGIHICVFKGVDFVISVTYAHPLVVMNEMPCDYRKRQTPVWNVSAKRDL